MIPHTIDKEELIKQLETDPINGLSSATVTSKLKQYGKNMLKEAKKKSNLQRFFDQFKDVMILILIIAAIISFIVAIYEKEFKEFLEPILIILIVILNAVMGVLQESKAEKALEALKKLSSPNARVIRENKEQIIDASLLVPGDIIKLEAGDFIPADARILQSSSLRSEEAALTGESVPSEKDADDIVLENAPLGDRTNMVYTGCSITYGTAIAVVTATGMDTEMGRVANLLESETSTQTPLQSKLSSLGTYLGIVALAASAVIFLVGIIDGMPVMQIFMIAVALAVSAIPEGLPAIVTIILSVGVQRMVKKNAIIRNLPAVETLGSASIICSDKTGTLTQNKMTLLEAYSDGMEEVEKISENNTEEIRTLLQYATLCSNGSVVFTEKKEKLIGDPTETAIVYSAYINEMVKEDLNKEYPRKAEIPFDSDRKLMSVINVIDGKNVVIVKGAFDILIEKCIKGDKDKAKAISDKMGGAALRVIGIAYKYIDSLPEDPNPKTLEKDLIFMGLVGMIDPPRPEAQKAVALCRKAGIKPVMITGDHVITASAIAREIGILLEGDEAITGAMLDSMTDSQFEKRIRNISVYARVSPENKIRIVRAWQRLGEVVAMTGDGVNDAPALKAADIGCAMGITGTDVAKGAADITLTDDNFATIVDAVREGRGIYANIKKVVGFLLGTNVGEILTVFLAMIIWRQAPLLSMQLLWINLVTDSLPAISLGMEDVESDVMEQKPKPRNEGLFAHGYGVRIILQGCMIAGITLAGFLYGKDVFGTLQAGQTVAFYVLSLSQVVHSFNMRSEHSLFKIGFFSNKKLNISCLISTAMIALVLFTPVSKAFGLVYLDLRTYLVGLGLSLSPLVLMEVAKVLGLIKAKKSTVEKPSKQK